MLVLLYKDVAGLGCSGVELDGCIDAAPNVGPLAADIG